MAVTIRLARAGAKKRPFYRLVVADKRAPRGGQARLSYWTGKGAQPAETVGRLLKRSVAAAKAAAKA